MDAKKKNAKQKQTKQADTCRTDGMTSRHWSHNKRASSKRKSSLPSSWSCNGKATGHNGRIRNSLALSDLCVIPPSRASFSTSSSIITSSSSSSAPDECVSSSLVGNDSAPIRWNCSSRAALDVAAVTAPDDSPEQMTSWPSSTPSSEHGDNSMDGNDEDINWNLKKNRRDASRSSSSTCKALDCTEVSDPSQSVALHLSAPVDNEDRPDWAPTRGGLGGGVIGPKFT